ncbi:MAG TPA: hypothetical protein VN719_09540 [Gemmatimonadales bacterium]|nr:hypothetical protein [Gemmatimonadales bacterium]
MDRYTWGQEARESIDRALEEGRRLGLEGRELERFVSKAYPFQGRENYPYKVWLREFDRLVRGDRRRRERRSAERREAEPDQELLFE